MFAKIYRRFSFCTFQSLVTIALILRLMTLIQFINGLQVPHFSSTCAHSSSTQEYQLLDVDVSLFDLHRLRFPSGSCSVPKNMICRLIKGETMRHVEQYFCRCNRQDDYYQRLPALEKGVKITSLWEYFPRVKATQLVCMYIKFILLARIIIRYYSLVLYNYDLELHWLAGAPPQRTMI